MKSNLSDTNISILNQSQPLPNPLVEFSPFNIPPVPVAKSTRTHSSNKLKITTDSSTSPMFKNDSTFSHSLSQSYDTPLTKEEEKLNTTCLVGSCIMIQRHRLLDARHKVNHWCYSK